VSSKHKDWKLIVCGSGNTEYFKKFCIKYRIGNVEFPGFVNMEEYYTKASILCNTSVAEGWGLVLVEAIQYGCTPLAFDSYASVHDIIESGNNGYIVPAFNENEYARKLALLMSDENLRQKMSSNGRESINRFNPKDIAQQWVVLFKKLMSA
jgi:glycosyltransferase involved in cell wall biosynthesis